MGKTVVVGAGVIGLTIAYELGKRGIDTVVVDRASPGAGSSPGNAGWIVPSLSAPIPAPGLIGTSLRWMFTRGSPLYINPRMSRDRARWLWRFLRNCREEPHRAGLHAMIKLNRATMALFDRLKADGVTFEMRQSGVLFLGLSQDALDSALVSLRALEDIGYRPPEILSAGEVGEIVPHLSTEVAGGFRVAEERHIRPETLLRGLVRKLADLGIVIQEGVEVTGADRRGRAITSIRTPEGNLPVDRCIIAAGAWSGHVAQRFGFPLPIEAGKGYSVTFDAPHHGLTQPMDFIEARTVFTPFEDSFRIAGMMELSGLDPRLEQDRVATMLRAASRYFEWNVRSLPHRAWAGLRSLTPDGLPAIGRIPLTDNLFVATGHGMLGVTLAPVTAVAIADLASSGSSSIDLGAFSPARFA